MEIDRYREFHQKLFSSIEDFGFKIQNYSEEPRAFDNFIASFSNGLEYNVSMK